MMIDDIVGHEIWKDMERSSVKQWTENVWETGCLEPALQQNTNHDETLNLYQDFLFRSILFELTRLDCITNTLRSFNMNMSKWTFCA